MESVYGVALHVATSFQLVAGSKLKSVLEAGNGMVIRRAGRNATADL